MQIVIELPRPMEAEVTNNGAEDPSDMIIKVSPRFYAKTSKAQVLYAVVKADQGQKELRYMLEVSGATGRLTLTPIEPVTCAFDESQVPAANPTQARAVTTNP